MAKQVKAGDEYWVPLLVEDDEIVDPVTGQSFTATGEYIDGILRQFAAGDWRQETERGDRGLPVTLKHIFGAAADLQGYLVDLRRRRQSARMGETQRRPGLDALYRPNAAGAATINSERLGKLSAHLWERTFSPSSGEQVPVLLRGASLVAEGGQDVPPIVRCFGAAALVDDWEVVTASGETDMNGESGAAGTPPEGLDAGQAPGAATDPVVDGGEPVERAFTAPSEPPGRTVTTDLPSEPGPSAEVRQFAARRLAGLKTDAPQIRAGWTARFAGITAEHTAGGTVIPARLSPECERQFAAAADPTDVLAAMIGECPELAAYEDVLKRHLNATGERVFSAAAYLASPAGMWKSGNTGAAGLRGGAQPTLSQAEATAADEMEKAHGPEARARFIDRLKGV